MIDLFHGVEDENFEACFKRNPEKRDFINNLFNQNKEYLDSHFVKEFKSNTFDRLWELYILHILKNHDVDLCFNKEKGPDFCIPNFIDEKPLYIECVCPGIAKAGKELSDGGFTSKWDPPEIMKYPNGELEFKVGWSSGHDHYLISRITRSIKDKSKKFDRYTEDQTVLKNSFKILCINGYKVMKDFPNLTLDDWNDHVHAAIYGKENIIYEKSSRAIFCEYEPISIKKPTPTGEDKLIAGSNQNYLKKFDAIASLSICPFFGSDTMKIVHLNEQVKFLEKLEKILT